MLNKHLLVISLLFISICSFGQTNEASSIRDQKVLHVDTMPEYPGGFDEMVNFIIDHVQYPDSAKKHRIEGRVLISFVVDSNGTLYDFVVEKSVSKDLDEEALRVCRLFPRFKPGIYHGKAVKSRFSIPMTFKLSEPEIKEEGPK